MLNLLLIPYCTLAYGIHGGELVTGLNRQFRNLLCAVPFGAVPYTVLSTHYDFPVALALFASAFIGTNEGFDNHPLWLKGLINFPPLGIILLPLAYRLASKPARQEYLSGFLYGLALTGISYAG